MKKYIRYFILFLSLFSLFVSIVGCAKNIPETDIPLNGGNTKVTVQPGDIVNSVNPVFTPFALDEFIKNSDAIITGKVFEILPAKEGFDPVMYSEKYPVIYTDVIIQVDKILLGKTQTDKVAVRLLGGRIGKNVFTADEATFTLGENVLVFLFLETHFTFTPVPSGIDSQSYYRVVRLFQGKFNLNGDSAINAEGESLSTAKIEKRILELK